MAAGRVGDNDEKERGQWLRGRVGDNDEKEQWSRHALPCSNAHLTIGLRDITSDCLHSKEANRTDFAFLLLRG